MPTVRSARLSETLIRMAVDWVNVTSTEPGAAGNGRADDTLALQRAIADVNEIGGGFVYLPDALTTPVRL